MFKRFWWVFLITLVVGPILGLLTAGVITYIQPKIYESKAVVQVRPPVSIEIPNGTTISPDQSPSPSFFATEFEIIKAQKTLDLVIDKLDLTSRWILDRETVRTKLIASIKTENIQGTDLIEIQIRTTSPEDSQLIAKELATAYREQRRKLEAQRTEFFLKELRDAVQQQEITVEDKRKTLTTIIRSQQLLDYGKAPGVIRGSSFSVNDQTRMIAHSYAELSERVVMLKSQVETFLKYDGDELMTYAGDLQLPENIIRTLYPQYLETKRSLDALKLGGLGDSHPNVKQQEELLDGMRRDLDEGVVALRESLQAQLEITTEQQEHIKSEMKRKRENTSKSGVTRHSFNDAKAEFETAQRLLEQLKIKLVGEEMQHRISESPIIIHAEPTLPISPVSPNIPLNLIIGLLSGFTAGLFTPFLVIPVLNKILPRIQPTPTA